MSQTQTNERTSKNRIQLFDSVMDALHKVSEGNPGALTVCMRLMAETPRVDPRAAFGGLGMLMSFDDMGIYGSQIWVLYKDVCGESYPNLIALFRGHQLGMLSECELFTEGRDFVALAADIKAQIGTFNYPIPDDPDDDADQT